jgi:hypothetical protein
VRGGPIGALMLATALVAAACSRTNLPTRNVPDLGGAPGALLEGTLVADGPCVYLDWPGPPAQRWLVIWPFGYQRDRDAILDGDRPVATIGGFAGLGGGEAQTDEAGTVIFPEMAGEIPADCRVGLYWSAYSITRTPLRPAP